MKDRYLGALLEEIDGKIDAMAETLASKLSVEDGNRLTNAINRINSESSIIRKVIKDESTITRGHTKTINDHEIRIIDLEDEDKLKYA